MRIDPFHLAATPAPLLPNYGIVTELGLSAVDPAGQRHKGQAFDIWLTLYRPDGSVARRWKQDELEAGERKFLDVSAITKADGFNNPHLCTVHRIPKGLKIESDFMAEVPDDFDRDFSMYRTVVQLVHPKGGKGSVIFEVAHSFNSNPTRKASLLVFSNQAAVGADTRTLLLLLHYSTARGYNATAKRKLIVFGQDGKPLTTNTTTVPAFGVDVTDFGSLPIDVPKTGFRQYSFVGCSTDAALIPLIVNINDKMGGVSIEHTHAPNSYLNMPMADMNRVRKSAIDHYMGLECR